MPLTKCYWRKTDALKQIQAARGSRLPTNWGLWSASKTQKSVHRRPQQQARRPWRLSSDGLRSSARWANLSQVLKGLKARAVRRRWPVSCGCLSQPHLLPHLTTQSLHVQGCRNRDRETSWLGPNATPYQAVGPSAQKRPHKNGKCPPHLQVQRALQKAGINESSKEGTDLNKCLDFPLENCNANFFLVANRDNFCSVILHGVECMWHLSLSSTKRTDCSK